MKRSPPDLGGATVASLAGLLLLAAGCRDRPADAETETASAPTKYPCVVSHRVEWRTSFDVPGSLPGYHQTALGIRKVVRQGQGAVVASGNLVRVRLRTFDPDPQPPPPANTPPPSQNPDANAPADPGVAWVWVGIAEESQGAIGESTGHILGLAERNGAGSGFLAALVGRRQGDVLEFTADDRFPDYARVASLAGAGGDLQKRLNPGPDDAGRDRLAVFVATPKTEKFSTVGIERVCKGAFQAREGVFVDERSSPPTGYDYCKTTENPMLDATWQGVCDDGTEATFRQGPIQRYFEAGGGSARDRREPSIAFFDFLAHARRPAEAGVRLTPTAPPAPVGQGRQDKT